MLGAGRQDRRRRRPADARARQPRDRARRGGRASCSHIDGERHELAAGDTRDLRRRPAAPLREPRSRRGGDPRRRQRRAAAQLTRPHTTTENEMSEPTTLLDKIWADARGRRRPDLHRPAPRPRGHERAGVRRPAARRPHGSPARPHARDRRPQRPDRRHAGRRADQGRALARAGRDARAQLRGVRDPRLLARLRPPGHRSRDRAGARHHAAGHDDRLRRQPHGDARRVRRARVRHRHERGRARAGDAVPRPAQAALDADPLRGRARLRRHGQGPDPRDDRPDRRRRAPSATSSSTPARRSRRSRWRAA